MNKTSQWNSVFTFIMAMIGLTIGIGNIWRFSYVLYSNGGGSFFIPYVIAILVMGIPFLILEYGLGFSFKKSFSNLMHSIRPEFEIIAWMLVLFVFVVVIYYMIILGWDFAYLLNSFTLGWGNDPASFFTNYVGGSGNIMSSHTIILPTLICTLILWGFFWIVSIKDVDKGIGRVSSILIPLLFTIMIFIFIYSFTLPGFHLGLTTLLTPDWSALLNINVWLAAFGQIIFSLSIGQAMVYTYASYLPKNTKLVNEVLFVVIANTLYEIFIALGVFSILGYMSISSSIPMNELISEGTGLIFIVFPQIFNEMTPSSLMCMEFYSDGQGHIDYLGLSLFHTTNGAYTGNILASEEVKQEMISRYVTSELMTNVREKICQEAGALFNQKYRGPFGVDMMIIANGTDFLLHPCVEINLRRTMGHTALALSPKDDRKGVMRIDYADNTYRLKVSVYRI